LADGRLAWILSGYRGLPGIFATVLAVLISVCAATGLAALAAFILGFTLQTPEGASGPGVGVVVVCSIPIVAIPTFVAALSALIHLHHPTSGLTPSLAFAICAILTWWWMPFGLTFAPVLLGTGAIAWLISCYLLRKRGGSTPDHAI